MTLTILENRFDIIFRSGRRAGERLSLHRKSAALGRAPENDVHLDDPSVSRHHATIYQLGGVWMIRDEGSSRGTYLNYHMLNGPTRLRDRDVLMLGCLELEICDSKRVASPVEQPAPSPQQECSATNARHTWKRAALCSVLSCTATAAIAYTYVLPGQNPDTDTTISAQEPLEMQRILMALENSVYRSLTNPLPRKIDIVLHWD